VPKRDLRVRTNSYIVALVALCAPFVAGCSSGEGSASAGPSLSPTPLLDPTSPEWAAAPPDSFRVLVETTQGDFVVSVTTSQAPLGAQRFYHLVRHGFYDGTHFFRVLQGFVVQFGIHRNPEVSRIWLNATIPDDPVIGSNLPGTLSYGTAGPNTRTTQLFINLGDNSRLDGLGFSPFARITGGMDVVARLYGGYGEGAPQGNGPDQGRIQSEGSTYLERDFPRLDRIVRARVLTLDP
jgi:peptidyl-prolyl cis-trans isomerase A (cyclophilin A)